MKPVMFIVSFLALLLLNIPALSGEELVIADFKNGITNWTPSGSQVEIKDVPASEAGKKAMQVSFYGDPDIPRQGMSVRTYLNADNCPQGWLAKGYKRISIWIKGNGTDNQITMKFCNSGPLLETGVCTFDLKKTAVCKIEFPFDKMVGPFGEANVYLSLEISKPVSECSFVLEGIVVEK